jgi:hypothetical protein
MGEEGFAEDRSKGQSICSVTVVPCYLGGQLQLKILNGNFQS